MTTTDAPSWFNLDAFEIPQEAIDDVQSMIEELRALLPVVEDLGRRARAAEDAGRGFEGLPEDVYNAAREATGLNEPPRPTAPHRLARGGPRKCSHRAGKEGDPGQAWHLTPSLPAAPGSGWGPFARSVWRGTASGGSGQPASATIGVKTVSAEDKPATASPTTGEVPTPQ